MFQKIAGLSLLLCLLASKISFAQSEEQLSKKVEEFYYSNLDSALLYVDQLEQFYVDQNKIEDALSVGYKRLDITGYHFDQQENKIALDKFSNLLNQYKRQSPDEKKLFITQGTYEYMLASYYYEQNNYAEAKRIFRQLADRCLKHPESNTDEEVINLMANSITTLGSITTKEKNFNEANQLFNYVIDFLKNTDHDLTFELPNAHYLYGASLSKQGIYKKSNDHLIPSYNYTSTTNKHVNRMARLTSLISENYSALNQTDSSKYYLDLQKKFLPKNHKFWEDHYVSEYQFFTKANNQSAAKKAIQKAIPFSEQKWGNENHPEIAELYGLLSKTYLQENKLDSASLAISQAINMVQNYEIESVYNQIILFDLYKIQAKILSQSNVKEDKLRVIELTKQATKIIDEVSTKLNADQDLVKFIEDSYELFELGIRAAIDAEDIESAFFFMEKSKANTLLKSFYNARAYSLARVPETIIEKERQLKTEITGLEKKGKAENTKRLLELNVALNHLIAEIEADYPQYYELKYGDRIVSLSDLRTKLNEEQALISYFAGKEKTYAIVISNNEESVLELPKLDADESLIQFYELLKEPDTDLAAIKTLGKSIYERFLMPAQSALEKELIIIPDGLLSYIPVEALVNEKEEYLIYDYAVSYAPSASLWSVLEQKSSKNKLLGIAPTFDGSPTLATLPNNREEVQSIAKLFPSKELMEQSATKPEFLEMGSSYNILHFATHAILNDENPSQSHLVFAGRVEDDDENLSLSEIYNLDLKDAKIVTLSACDTGIGQLKKGEGFFSLARAFFYSGTSSITSSLWQINDGSTANIMSSYYHQLAQGKNKAAALQQAKLDFLEENNNNSRKVLQHPYYWSAFVLSGNVEPIKSDFPWLWVGLGGLLLISGLIWLLRRK